MRLLTASSTTPSHALPCPPPSVSVSPLSLFSCFTICSSRASTAPQCISPLRSLTLHSSLAAELLSISSTHRWPRGRAFTLKSYSSPCVLQDKSAPAFVAQRVLRNKERFNNFSRLNLSVFFVEKGGISIGQRVSEWMNMAEAPNTLKLNIAERMRDLVRLENYF